MGLNVVIKTGIEDAWLLVSMPCQCFVHRTTHYQSLCIPKLNLPFRSGYMPTIKSISKRWLRLHLIIQIFLEDVPLVVVSVPRVSSHVSTSLFVWCTSGTLWREEPYHGMMIKGPKIVENTIFGKTHATGCFFSLSRTELWWSTIIGL